MFRRLNNQQVDPAAKIKKQQVLCVFGDHTQAKTFRTKTHTGRTIGILYITVYIYIYVKEQDTAADDFASSLRHYTQDIFPTFPGTPWHISLLTKTQTASSSLLTVTFHPIPVICAPPPPPPPPQQQQQQTPLLSCVFPRGCVFFETEGGQ